MCLDQFDEDVKDEPLSEEDFKAQAKDRMKKDNHNMSKYLSNYLYINLSV